MLRHSVLWPAVLAAACATGWLRAEEVAVVCPAEFRPALKPWIERRMNEGRTLAFIANDGSAADIRAAIRVAGRHGDLRFVVLVGDADPRAASDGGARARGVPTFLVPARANRRWGREAEIATDNGYADLDGDDVPDVAVGRISVDSAAELEIVVRKILAYESRRDFGPWRRRVNFVTGVSGLGPLVDAAFEYGSRRLIDQGLPAGYEATLTAGDWRSPYSPDPREFRAAAIERLNEDCLFWVYMGHAERRSLAPVFPPSGVCRGFGCDDLPLLKARDGGAIAVFLACYTAAFDGDRDSLAEELLRAEAGPVAAIGGSRTTMPYGLTVFGLAAMRECFAERRATLGEMVLHAKRQMLLDRRDDPGEQALDRMATWLTPGGAQLSVERREHVQMLHLLGDPTLRLRQPLAITLTAAAHAAAGSRLTLRGRSPLAGRLSWELASPADRPAVSPPSRQEFDSTAAGLLQCQEIYRRANRHRVCEGQMAVAAGEFAVELAIPEDCCGPHIIRAHIAGEADHALGACPLSIIAPPRIGGAERSALTSSGDAAPGD